MNDYNVLRKGIFEGARADFPFAEQFIIAEKEGKKVLFIRIFNPLDKTIDGVKIKIRTYDKDDKVVSEEILGFVCNCKGEERAILPEAIQIDERAVTCEAEIQSVVCEGESLRLIGNKVKSFYDPDFAQKTDVAGALKKNKQQSSVAYKPSKVLAFVSICFLLIAMLVTIFALNGYADACDVFVIDNVKYRFANPIEKDGDIIVAGHNGLAKDIVIPQDIQGHRVVGIDGNAFYWNHQIRSVTIDAEVAIADNAFCNCFSLESVKIKKPLSIGKAAFWGCSSLKSFEIEDSSQITEIADETFKGCSNLRRIDIPKNVVSIGREAFTFCHLLESVNFPESLNVIKDDAFRDCAALSSLNLPQSLSYLGSWAFAYCVALEKVVVPQSTSIIEYGAFDGCIGLKEFEFGSSDCSFASIFNSYSWESTASYSLEKITFTGEVVSQSLFSNAYNVKNVWLPNASYIDDFAFSDCHNLQSIRFSDKLKYIGDQSFRYCWSLEELSFPQKMNYIGNQAFYGCSSLQSVRLPLSLDALGSGVFSACGELTEAVLPENLTTIPDTLFSSCMLLEKVVIPDGVKSIEYDAFSGCRRLSSITLPKTLENIGERAFESCSALTKIEIPSSVENVGRGAFADCNMLEEISLPRIYNSYFNHMFGGYEKYDWSRVPSSLKKVSVSSSDISSNAFYECCYIEEINIENATSIGERAFDSCSALRAIKMNAVQSIGQNAFENCRSLSNLTLPDTLTKLEYGSFWGCSSLVSITLPSSLSVIEDQAFGGCYRLYEIFNLSPLSLYKGDYGNGQVAYYAKVIHTSIDAEPAQVITTDELVELIKIGEEYIVTRYTGDNVSLVLRDLHYDGITVSSYSLSRDILRGTSVARVVIGPQVYALSEQSFADNYNLQTVDMSESMLPEIPSNCFSSCTNLYDVKLSTSTTRIGSNAFNYCTSLATIELPTDISIGSYAFQSCYGLESIVIPSGATIDYGAFSYCYNLIEVYNLSGLDLSNYYETGNVAYYALKIYTSNTQPSSVIKFTDSQGIKYAICDDVAYLYGVDTSQGTAYYYYLNNIVKHDSKEYPCVVCSKAFERLGWYFNLVVPKTLKFKNDETYISNYSNVYYRGTAQEWNENFSGGWWNGMYYKADCVHEYGFWTEKDGQIIDNPNLSHYIVKEATCKEEGVGEYTCNYCGKKTQEIIPIDHNAHKFVDNKCTECGLELIRITQDNIYEYFDVRYDSEYPFELKGETFTSTNKWRPSTESSVVLTAKGSYGVELSYTVSSEEYCDLLTIELNGDRYVEISGIYGGSQTWTGSCYEGEWLGFRYSKNWENDVGEDVAKILYLNIYARS